MIKLGALLLLLAGVPSAFAQVSLYTVQGIVETPVDESFDFGSVANGDTEAVVFRMKYTGNANPYYLTFFSCCNGIGFSVTAKDWQSLPAPFPASGFLDFSINFQPDNTGTNAVGYSATLTITQDPSSPVFLIGKGTPGLALLLDNQPLVSGQALGFGDIQVGSTGIVKLILANQTAAALTVPNIQPLTGSAFSLWGPALSGPSVAPDSSVELDIAFVPTVTGPQQTMLTIGALSFPLQGTGTAPPPPIFPQPSILVNLPSTASAQQGTIGVSLAAPSPAAGTGTVTLAFQPANGLNDDPTVTFSDGSGSASFTVAPGDSTGHFSGGPSIKFGTGTTAGMLVFTLALGSNTAHTNVVIPAAMMGIDAAVAARDVSCAPAELFCTTTNVELQVNGWDNTRTASQIMFRFYDSSGKQISPGTISVDSTAAFQAYFATSGLGGVFAMHALFPVTGDAEQVVAADVQITNSAGTALTTRIEF